MLWWTMKHENMFFFPPYPMGDTTHSFYAGCPSWHSTPVFSKLGTSWSLSLHYLCGFLDSLGIQCLVEYVRLSLLQQAYILSEHGRCRPCSLCCLPETTPSRTACWTDPGWRRCWTSPPRTSSWGSCTAEWTARRSPGPAPGPPSAGPPEDSYRSSLGRTRAAGKTHQNKQ